MDTDSNHRHKDFQSFALPTELSRVTPQLFISALNLFDSPSKVIFGGHSLGALMSLKASMLTKVDLVCCVGFGLDHPSKPHLFETPLFQETLHLRSQLVSPSIRHEILFPWLKEQKINLNISNQKYLSSCGTK